MEEVGVGAMEIDEDLPKMQLEVITTRDADGNIQTIMPTNMQVWCDWQRVFSLKIQ